MPHVKWCSRTSGVFRAPYIELLVNNNSVIDYCCRNTATAKCAENARGDMVLPNPRAYAFIAGETGSLKVFQHCFNVKTLCRMMHRCFLLLLCLVATVAGLYTGLPITGVQEEVWENTSSTSCYHSLCGKRMPHLTYVSTNCTIVEKNA